MKVLLENYLKKTRSMSLVLQCEKIAANRAMDTTLFSAAISIWILSHMAQESVFADSSTMMVKTLRVIAFALIACLEVSRLSSQNKEDWVLGFLLVPFVVSGFISHNTVLVQGLVFCYSARRSVDIETSLKVILLTISVALVSIIACSQFGVLEEGLLSASMGGGVRLRSSLGFAWPSRAPNYFLTVLLLFILGFRTIRASWRLLIAVVFLIINYLLFAATDSRSPALVALVAIVGFIVLGKMGERRVPRCVSLAFVVCMVGIGTLTFFYTPENEAFMHLNALLSGRLRYSHTGIQNYSLTLLGSNQINLGDPLTAGYFDCGYLRMLYYWGVIPSLLFLGGITLTLYEAARRGDLALCFVFVLLAVHSTIEGRLVLLNYSPFLIYMGPAVLGSLHKINLRFEARKEAA